MTVNDALEEVAQSQNYISATVEAEIGRILETMRKLEVNATDVMDDNEIGITMVAINSTKKVNLLSKFAQFLEVNVEDCLFEVEESMIDVQKNAMIKFKQCVLSVLDETDAFVKDTVEELKTNYFLTYPIATNLQDCPNYMCIEKTLAPLTQLANDAMIGIINLSDNTIDLIYNMDRSFEQCSIGNVREGEAKIVAIANAVAKCINDKIRDAPVGKK